MCVTRLWRCVCVYVESTGMRFGERLNHTVDVNKGYFRPDNHRLTAASCSGLYFPLHMHCNVTVMLAQCSTMYIIK